MKVSKIKIRFKTSFK